MKKCTYNQIDHTDFAPADGETLNEKKTRAKNTHINSSTGIDGTVA